MCSDHLANWYYEKDGKLYCRKHYWEKFGELCHGCSLLMTGPAMVSPRHLDSNLIFVVLISSETNQIDFARAFGKTQRNYQSQMRLSFFFSFSFWRERNSKDS